MSLRKSFKISVVAVASALVFTAWVANAISHPQKFEETATYSPLKSISYEFGSKFMSGYFVEESGRCFITLMIIEKYKPDELLPLTAARVRLALDPGQIAGLDSEEGQSINVTCGDNAKTVLVDVGARDKLIAAQGHTPATYFARARQRD
jgi:hypothetical protein